MKTFSKSEVLAIVIQDVHLRHTAPVNRQEKGERWYSVLRRMLVNIQSFQSTLGEHVPVLVAGDIFHYWDSRPELINVAMKYIKNWYTIPGQHDLPYHDHESIEKSAYWTLATAGIIHHISQARTFCSTGKRKFTVHPYAWGKKIITPSIGMWDPRGLQVAMLHRYVWKDGFGHPKAKKEEHVKAYAEILKGFNVALFGDNHRGFEYKDKSGLFIWNGGGMYQSKIDEMDYKPRVGLLMEDGTVRADPIRAEPLWVEGASELKKLLKDDKSKEVFQVLEELSNVEDSFDFGRHVHEVCEKYSVNPQIRKIIITILEKAKASENA